ncbi:MAG: dihydropteroate synthase [Sulfuricurvum sp.]|uniref:dihydropteroate synthase n=1 Tax=Sulfuricurvum sp. TaxID=2025608 RepID=UPI0026362BF1|nr:dihydropteroate synthase [Sulfuricurvum sp.]MDD2828546.1 dihydropteroate synthase [Sulfuricurvum sp.]MDD4948923.1 dihydropteroate synthase [Sulfuricurvum sp.]
MVVEHLSSTFDLRSALVELGVDGGGISILSDKGKLHIFKIRDLHVGAANILKQDALSIGCDLAVPRGTVIASIPQVDVMLIANERQLRELVRKEKSQPFGLKNLSKVLERFCGCEMPKKIEVMGIINANDDSFYPQSRFNGVDAIRKIDQMIAEGADIIDIGGVSSRPGSIAISEEEEMQRVRPIIDALYEHKTYEKISLSLDSYAPSVISYALERGFRIVNDITGLANDEVARLCGEYGATAVIMHMKGTPESMQNTPHYDSVLSEIEQFFTERLERAEKFGIAKCVLDCGIGFGKTLEDNCALIRHQQHFLPFGKPLLVGASRKSMIDQISPTSANDRLAGTIALHLKAIEEGASIVRVHDVQEHVQAIAVWKALKG